MTPGSRIGERAARTAVPGDDAERRRRSGYRWGFYELVSGTSLPSARVVVPIVMELAPIRSVLDIGCGTGAWLSVFSERGVADLVGIDGEDVPPEALLIDAGRLVRADLAKPFDLGRRFDLVVSLEVGEHLVRGSAETLVGSIARHGDLVLFSAAIPGQAGTHHVNTQWPSWWAELFRARGYEVFDVVRPRIWRHESVALWYRNNAVVYARGTRLEQLRARAPAQGTPLDLVHPEMWESVIGEPRQLELGTIARALPGALYRSLRYRLGTAYTKGSAITMRPGTRRSTATSSRKTSPHWQVTVRRREGSLRPL
jgi:SAM-dependent methyltransferase